jgi:hypothetical protein
MRKYNVKKSSEAVNEVGVWCWIQNFIEGTEECYRKSD